MDKSNDLENYIDHLINDFFDTFDIKRIEDRKMQLQITFDMEATYAQLISELSEFKGQSFMSIDEYNGLMVPPKNINGTFTILINGKSLFENLEMGNYSWVGTIIHEVAHVIDYTEYAKLIKISNYKDFRLDNDKNTMFYLWTEFNARSKGYYFVRKYSFGDAMFDEGLIEDVINKELPFHDKILFEKYHSTDNGLDQCYHVVQYLGRLYTLHLIFPNYFNREKIKSMDVISGNKWMMDLYEFLSKNNKLEKAYVKFNDMKRILETNFTFSEK